MSKILPTSNKYIQICDKSGKVKSSLRYTWIMDIRVHELSDTYVLILYQIRLAVSIYHELGVLTFNV